MTMNGPCRPVGADRPAGADELAIQERRSFERRWWFFAGIWLVYLIDPLSVLWGPRHAVDQRVVGVALIVVFALVYLVIVPAGAFGGPWRRRIAALGAMVGSAALFVIFCGDGIAFAPYLAVTFLLLLPWSSAVPLALALCAAVTFLPQHVPGWDLRGIQWGIGAGTLFAGVIVGGLRLFAGTATRLHRAEEEIEQLAAEQERLRIARDLHDLLGHALTTVTLKADLASRLVTRDPQRAAAEMAEVAELGRQSLADVRATVSGYREVSLARELAAAREVLQAAGIEAELPAAAEDVPGDLRELFGWVVREGVTNAVRHSRARRVAVRVEGRTIEVVNDGVSIDGVSIDGVSIDGVSIDGVVNGEVSGIGSGDDGARSGGHGLIGLSERAAMLGGALQAGPQGGGGYRLRVEVPA
jgi:two-component system, NarL family, sensor histidine kinase DesK